MSRVRRAGYRVTYEYRHFDPNLIKKISMQTVTVPMEQVALISSNGSQNLVDGSITPIKDNGNIEGLVVIFRPIKR